MSIHKQMAAIMADIGHIAKDKKNAQQGFMFRGIDDVYNALHGCMAKHGVFTTSDVLDIQRSEKPTKNGGSMQVVIATMAYTFHAEDGSSVRTVVIGEGMDSGDKASNKAMAIAHKYALLQAFMVPTQEQIDPDAQVIDLECSAGLSEAINNILQCENIDELKSSFSAAWDSYRDQHSRKRLTEAKDKRKAELS